MLFRPPFLKIVCGYDAVFHECRIGGGAAGQGTIGTVKRSFTANRAAKPRVSYEHVQKIFLDTSSRFK
jgi:hypothetical protein